jgi:tetratricopeptide (TPR) repeat protein
LGELAAKGWLLHNRETDSYKMHVIISNVLRKQQSIDLIDVEPLIDTVSEKLSIDQTKDNPVDKFPWIPFGKALISIFPEGHENIISVLQNNLALRLQDLGDYTGAKELLEKAMRSAEKNFGIDHPTTAVSYSNLALVLKDLGDYDRALEFSKKALEILQNKLQPEHPNISTVKNNIESIKESIRRKKKT